MVNFNHPPFYKRLAAMFYDGILILAILLIGTGFALIFTKGKPIFPGNIYYQIFLITLIALFFIGFWCHGGQTIGMKAWKLHLLTQDERPLSYPQALLRFILAIPSLLFFGMGFLWLFFDKDKLTIYDRFSKTKIMGAINK